MRRWIFVTILGFIAMSAGSKLPAGQKAPNPSFVLPDSGQLVSKTERHKEIPHF